MVLTVYSINVRVELNGSCMDNFISDAYEPGNNVEQAETFLSMSECGLRIFIHISV